MFLKAFTVLDTKTGLHSAPFFVIHEAVAIRACIDMSNDPSSTIGRFPSDYVLMRIGEFDDNTGGMFQTAPVNMGVISSLKAQEA